MWWLTWESHKNVNTRDFKIVDKNFHNNERKQKCPEATYTDNYVGESACQLTERIKDHNGRDHTSQV